MATLDVRSHLQTCECGSTWWETLRQIQVFTRDSANGKRWPTAQNAEPLAYASRVVILCADCGRNAPQP